MMPRTLLTVGSLVVCACAWHGQAYAQSLAEVARAEEARRKALQAASKVYTNEDLRPDFSKPVPAPAPAAPGDPAPAASPEPGGEVVPEGATGAAAPPAPAGGMRDQAYWSNRIGEARSQLERSRAFAVALQNRVDMLWTDFVNRDDPAQRGAIEKQRLDAIADLDRLKAEIGEQEKAILAIEDEARREGVPPGWIRPPQ